MSGTANIKLVGLSAACLLAATFVGATAESVGGTWKGTLNCAKLSFTKGPQKVPISLTVSGTSVSYSRDIYNRDNTAVVGKEEGTGTVGADGAISLTSAWKGAGPNPKYTYTASYSGKLAKGNGNLKGTQIWSVEGKTENRECSIALKQ
jgi:hypothetical protein